MKRRTILIALVAVLLGLTCGWYWGSPWWTLWHMRKAAQAGDIATLSSYVDARAIGRGWAHRERARWRSALDSAIADPGQAGDLVDFARSELKGAEHQVDPAQLRATLSHASAASLSIRHRGLDRFELRKRDATGPVLSFRRDGLGWKLDGIRSE